MIEQEIIARYLEPLLRGDRKACRSVIEEAMQKGIPANSIYTEMIWPVMVEIENLHRRDKISVIQVHKETRKSQSAVQQKRFRNSAPR